MADVVAAEPALAAETTVEAASSAGQADPDGRSGPGFTAVASPTLPDPGPDSPPRNEWSEWYEPSEARRRYDQLPAYQQTAYQPPPYQPPAYEVAPYRQSGYQPPAYQRPPISHPGAQLPYPSPFEPRRRGGGPGNGGRQSRAPLLWLIVSAVVAIAVIAFVLILHPFSDSADTVSNAANATTTPLPTTSAAATRKPAATSTAATSTAAGATSPTASGSAPGSAVSGSPAERQAASAVATMLASSGADRTAIDSAYDDVNRCGPNLNGDAAVFDHAVSSRRALLASLATMPGRSALPPALLTELSRAWQASIAADQGLATWASDEVSQGCRAHDTGDRGYQASLTPDNEANSAKAAFVGQWNPIADSFGLPTYESSQL